MESGGELFKAKETRLLIEGPQGKLELVAAAPLSDGPLIDLECVAVVCHPHPLHGGTMDNKVATTLARTYRDLGLPVVRFNFRGVGGSEGHYSDGIGEVDDLLAVIGWLRVSCPGRRFLIAGFSFGSSIAAQVAQQLSADVRHLVLVAPPVERYRYDSDGRFPCPVVVIICDQDELVDVAQVYSWVKELKSPAKVIGYADASHFFHGKLGPFKRDLGQCLLDELLPDLSL